MYIYNYHPETKEYLGKTRLNDGDKNPITKGEYLIPANAITQWPTIKAGENQAVIFNGSGWSLTPDFRGVKCWLQTGAEIEISGLGQILPIDSINYDPVALAQEKTAEFEQAQVELEVTTEQPTNE